MLSIIPAVEEREEEREEGEEEAPDTSWRTREGGRVGGKEGEEEKESPVPLPSYRSGVGCAWKRKAHCILYVLLLVCFVQAHSPSLPLPFLPTLPPSTVVPRAPRPDKPRSIS
jgi:hypothetical protein